VSGREMVDVHALASRVESLYADWRALERAALLRAPSSRAGGLFCDPSCGVNHPKFKEQK